jgi:pyridoxal phosphate enzyme (YggS family)
VVLVTTVTARLQSIRGQLAQRTDRAVTLVGVTKRQPVTRVAEAVAAGLRDLANNYEQEGRALAEALRDDGLRWHFIGHIQSRKAKLLLDYHLVQSLDRASIAKTWQRMLGDSERRLDVLIEVNVGEEPTKSGVLPSALAPFLREIEPLSAVRVRGLMAMPPPLEPVEARRPFFRTMRALFEAHRDAEHFDVLSMGTSADYLVAVEEGATMIRLGETLFGPR